MTSPITKTIAAAVLAGGAIAGQPADAMTMRNCTTGEIRVVVEDIGDGGTEPAGTASLASGQSERIGTGDGPYMVSVMGQRQGSEIPRLIRNGLDGTGDYTVHSSGAIWSFRSGGDCLTSERLADSEPTRAAATTKGRYPLATIMLDGGIWVSKPYPALRLRNFTGHSVEIGSSAGDSWSTYRLVGRDRYEDPAGNVFVMTSRFKGAMNDVPYRYSWLE